MFIVNTFNLDTSIYFVKRICAFSETISNIHVCKRDIRINIVLHSIFVLYILGTSCYR